MPGATRPPRPRRPARWRAAAGFRPGMKREREGRDQPGACPMTAEIITIAELRHQPGLALAHARFQAPAAPAVIDSAVRELVALLGLIDHQIAITGGGASAL